MVKITVSHKVKLESAELWVSTSYPMLTKAFKLGMNETRSKELLGKPPYHATM